MWSCLFQEGITANNDIYCQYTHYSGLFYWLYLIYCMWTLHAPQYTMYDRLKSILGI